MGIVVAEDNDELGDGLPTMGEEAEAELIRSQSIAKSEWCCTCGKPERPGVMHRMDAPCYALTEQEKAP